MAKHDLIFWEKASTPTVVPKGTPTPEADESKGAFSSRRAATEEQEEWMRKNPGKWLRVDEKGNTPNDSGYKKTKTKGRKHLVHEFVDEHNEVKMKDI